MHWQLGAMPFAGGARQTQFGGSGLAWKTMLNEVHFFQAAPRSIHGRRTTVCSLNRRVDQCSSPLNYRPAQPGADLQMRCTSGLCARWETDFDLGIKASNTVIGVPCRTPVMHLRHRPSRIGGSSSSRGR